MEFAQTIEGRPLSEEREKGENVPTTICPLPIVEDSANAHVHVH